VVPCYEMNHSVLSSIPTSTQQLPIVSHFSSEDISSPLTTLDDDDLDFEEPSKEAARAEIYIIDTKYDPSHPKNVKVEYKGLEDLGARHRYTEKERKLALKATNSMSLNDFSQKVWECFVFFLIYHF